VLDLQEKTMGRYSSMRAAIEAWNPGADWNATQYLIFEDERTRPPRDLIAQISLGRAERIADLGCGPGNSTALLVDRYPDAEVIGLDSSPDMLQQARARLPGCRFIHADLANWTPAEPIDLLFANGSLQWVPDHQATLHRLLEALPANGVLAVQMPDNMHEPALSLMREVAGQKRLAGNIALRKVVAEALPLPAPDEYYDLLRPICSELDIWHTIYNNIMDGPEAIVEWFKGSSLLPYLSVLKVSETEDFLAAYSEEIRRHYPVRSDGKVLLRFPRLFIVARR
jgi:trans-aconitate 2-methyltransferase